MRTHFCLFLSCLFCFALPLVSGCGSENAAPSADVNAKNNEGKTPLDETNAEEKRAILRAVGAEFRGEDGNNKSPNPRLASFLAQLPPPYRQMGTYMWEAIIQGNEAEADRLAQECIKLAEAQGEPPNLIHSLHLALGREFLDASMFDSAKRHLSEVAKRGGRYVYWLALYVARYGDVDGGFSLLLDEIDRTPPPVGSELLQQIHAITLLLARVQPSETMFERIDDLMNRIETEEPVSPETITTLADYWTVRGYPERAISFYEDGLTRDNLSEAQTFVFQRNLAMRYSQVRGDHAKALEIINKMLATTKDNPFLAVLLDTKGFILINAGNPTEAIPVLRRAVELSTELQFPVYGMHMHLAYALHLDGRDAESRRIFDAARDRLTPFVPNMNKRGQAMYDALVLAHP